MTTSDTAAPRVITDDVVSALYVVTAHDAAIIISRVRQQQLRKGESEPAQLSSPPRRFRAASRGVGGRLAGDQGDNHK